MLPIYDPDDFHYPIQPIGYDATGRVIRFKENELLSYIKAETTLNEDYGLNEQACNGYGSKDHAHLSMLTGYSVSGWMGMSDSQSHPDWVDEVDHRTDALIKADADFADKMVYCMPHPVHEFDYDRLQFIPNHCVIDFVNKYTFRKLCWLVSHVYSRHSPSDVSQIFQLMGMTLGEYVYYMKTCTVDNPEWVGHYRRTMDHIKRNGIIAHSDHFRYIRNIHPYPQFRR